MPRFNYIALDARGQESTGLMEAGSSNEVIGQLRQSGFFPTSVYEEGKGGSDGAAAKSGAKSATKVARVSRPRAKMNITLFQRKKVKSKLLMIFTRQLATLIDAGLPLLRGLNVLARRVLGFGADAMLSRRWYYFVPAQGEPRKLVHRIESQALDALKKIDPEAAAKFAVE